MTPSRYRGNLRRASILNTANKPRSTVSKRRRQRHNNDPPTIENFHVTMMMDVLSSSSSSSSSLSSPAPSSAPTTLTLSLIETVAWRCVQILSPAITMTSFIAAFHDVNYGLLGMRGKMSSNCLWHACQALFVGLLLFSIGAVMSILGFHADGLLDPNNNSTEEITYDLYSDRTNVRFSKLSYAGPIVMGIGGFIIVATCVMTFEARDSASKVGPASYTGARTGGLYTNTYRARTRSLDVRSVGSQTMAESNSSSITALHIFDKKALLETFRKFSRTLRTGSTCKEEDQFHRSPSAPNLLAATEGTSSSSSKLTTSTTSRISSVTNTATAAAAPRRASVLPKCAKSRIPPSLKQLRATMSVDYKSTSPFILPSVTAASSTATIVTEATVSGNTGVGSSKTTTTTTAGIPTTSSSTGEPTKALTSPNNNNNCTGSNKNGSSQIRIPKSQNCKYNRKLMGCSVDNHYYTTSHEGDAPNNVSTALAAASTATVSLPTAEVPCCSSQICVNTNSMDSTNASGSTTRQPPRPIHHHPGFRRSSNPNVHFEPATVELHGPHKTVTLNNVVAGPSSTSSSIEAVSGSCSPLRQPCPRSEGSGSGCSSFDRSSVRNVGEMNRSCSVAVSSSSGGSRPKLKSELSCRPMLMRQSRIDHCEIISVPDSDDEPI